MTQTTLTTYVTAVRSAAMTTEQSGCNHHWRSISGTNDYECDACGAHKLDNGEVVESW